MGCCSSKDPGVDAGPAPAEEGGGGEATETYEHKGDADGVTTFKDVDTDGDGIISLDEAKSHVNTYPGTEATVMMKYDTDGDGVISDFEFSQEKKGHKHMATHIPRI